MSQRYHSANTRPMGSTKSKNWTTPVMPNISENLDSIPRVKEYTIPMLKMNKKELTQMTKRM
jgi:hypothetical protein